MFTLFIYEEQSKSSSAKELLVHQSCHSKVDDARRAFEDYCKSNPSIGYTRYHHIIDSNGQHWE